MHSLRLHRAAEHELNAAYLWYYERDPVIADEFEQAVYRLLDQIQPDPTRFARLDDHNRSVLLGKFPYQIIFRVDRDQSVMVVAFAHTSRRPGFWSER